MIQSGIKQQIKEELARLCAQINSTESKLQEFTQLPAGTLTCERRGFMAIQYYLNQRVNKKTKVKYLGTPNTPIVQQYKKKYYFQKFLEILKHNKKVLERTLKELKDYSVEAIHEHLPNAYKFLPKECYKDEQLEELTDWADKSYKRNSWKLPDNPTIACDGTEMRSKGEALYYDDFYRSGIPFQYDSIHTFFDKDGVEHRLSPDFLVKCKDGKLVAVEHFGKLDDMDYAETNAKRLHEYLLCGFVLGQNLFVTSDNVDHNTNELAILETIAKVKKRVFGT